MTEKRLKPADLLLQTDCMSTKEVIPYLVKVNITSRDNYLSVKETLTRMGVAALVNGEDTLYQSCHIIMLGSKTSPDFYIAHFKMLFLMDGGTNGLTPTDIGRQNKVCALLADWGLITLVDATQILHPMCGVEEIKVVRHSDKDLWVLRHKYNLSTRKWSV